MTIATPQIEDFSLVLGGPLYQALLRSGLVKPPLDRVGGRIGVLSIVAWLPLAFLTLIGGRFAGGVRVPFLSDFELHSRLLLSLPLLLLAEVIVHMRMRAITSQFLERHIIPEDLRPSFASIISSAMRLRNSVTAEIVLLLFVFAAGPWLWRQTVALHSDTWYATRTASGTVYTAAGWWYGFVSVPVFQFILLRWYYRLFIWWRFLFQVSRLNLDLVPRAYLIAPLNSNAVTVTWGGYHGAIDLAGTIPVTGFTGTYYVPVLSYSHVFDFLGRSANFTGSLPYAVGTFSAVGPNGERQVYRSGLVDLSFRFSVNLRGGPAMLANDWVKWRQKVLLGASVKVVAPTGQYDPRRAVNWDINRWAIKPEFGYSQRWGSWLLDGYAGVWFFTPNDASFSPSGQVRQTQNPIGSFEGHFSHDFIKMRAWVSLDSNFWFGGTIARNGLLNPATRQTSSRLGGTGSLPVSRYQSIKVGYSYGTYVRYGGNYHQLAVAWQYSWIGKRF